MKILITGGAGTLGHAFACFLAREHEVTIVDNNEWAVAQFDVSGVTVIMNDYYEVYWDDFDLVIHCAAYKHVDLCQKNQAATLANNYENFKDCWVNTESSTKMLFISTDKAVEPISFYGVTKQRGERLVLRTGGVVARLGNIKSSSGSVIPKWENCFSENLPLPITDPDMTRYMIDVDDAVRKIWSLYEVATPGTVIIPSMGDPIRLGDLVEQLFPGYPTRIIGPRPGEKVNEKLKWDDESTVYEDDNGQIVTRGVK